MHRLIPIMCLTIVFSLAAGCSKSSTPPKPAPASEPAKTAHRNVHPRAMAVRNADPDLKQVVADVFGNDADAIDAARKADCDYLDTIARSLSGDVKAMHALFDLSTREFNDKASDSLEAALGFVLRDSGDRYFCQCLAKEPEDVQDSVRECILDDLGYPETDEEMQDCHRLYPRLFPAGWVPVGLQPTTATQEAE